MTHRRINTVLWTAAGILLSLLVLLVVISGLKGQVFILDPEGVSAAADSLMNAIREEDWDTLNSCIDHEGYLQPRTGEADTPQRLIWDAYRQSLRWNCSGNPEVRYSRVLQKCTVTCLNMTALSRRIAEIMPEIAGNLSDGEALKAAAEAALSEELPLLQKEITLSFVRKAGKWQLLPDNALLALLSGFAAG